MRVTCDQRHNCFTRMLFQNSFFRSVQNNIGPVIVSVILTRLFVLLDTVVLKAVEGFCTFTAGLEIPDGCFDPWILFENTNPVCGEWPWRRTSQTAESELAQELFVFLWHEDCMLSTGSSRIAVITSASSHKQSFTLSVKATLGGRGLKKIKKIASFYTKIRRNTMKMTIWLCWKVPAWSFSHHQKIIK